MRHLLRIVRLPGTEAVVTIDGQEMRVVRIKVTDDVTEVLFDEPIKGEQQ